MLLIGEALRGALERANERDTDIARAAVTTVTRSSSLTKYGTSFVGSPCQVASYALTVNQT